MNTRRDGGAGACPPKQRLRLHGRCRRDAATRSALPTSLLLVQTSSRRPAARPALGGFRSACVSSHAGDTGRRCWSGRSSTATSTDVTRRPPSRRSRSTLCALPARKGGPPASGLTGASGHQGGSGRGRSLACGGALAQRRRFARLRRRRRAITRRKQANDKQRSCEAAAVCASDWTVFGNAERGGRSGGASRFDRTTPSSPASPLCLDRRRSRRQPHALPRDCARRTNRTSGRAATTAIAGPVLSSAAQGHIGRGDVGCADVRWGAGQRGCNVALVAHWGCILPA
jgi:hypothetical protein